MTDTTDHPSRRAGLRDELRRAVCEAEGFVWDSDMLEPDEYGDHADTVLAVLYREWPWLRAEAEDAASVVVPAADRAALRDRIAAAVQPLLMDALPKPIAAARADEVADVVLSVLPAPADRAAEARVRALHQQYRFAGDDTTDYCSHCNQISGGWIPWPCPTIRALAVESAVVDRVAAETPPAEAACICTEDAWPPHCPCRADEYPAAVEAQPGNDTETPAPVYDRRAWETYSRDAGCGCTAPDPTDCAISHGTGAWLCVCHRLAGPPLKPE